MRSIIENFERVAIAAISVFRGMLVPDKAGFIETEVQGSDNLTAKQKLRDDLANLGKEIENLRNIGGSTNMEISIKRCEKGDLIKTYLAENTDLSNMKINNVIIKDFDFGYANFTGTEINLCEFIGCNFRKVKWDKTECNAIKFIKSELTQCNFSTCIFRNISLIKTNLLEIVPPKLMDGTFHMDESWVTKGHFENAIKIQYDCGGPRIRNIDTVKFFPFGFGGNSFVEFMMLKFLVDKNQESSVVFPKDLVGLITQKIIALPPSASYVKMLEEKRAVQKGGKQKALE
jgi:hypothetical protein